MTASLTSLDALLKEFYIGPLRNAVNDESNIETLTTKDTDSISGRNAVISIHVGRNSGVGFGSETGTAPSAGNQSYLQVSVPTKKIWGTWRITAEIEAATRSTQGAFAKVMKEEMIGLKNDLRDLKNKHFISDGTGALGTITDAAAENTDGDATIQLADINDAIYFEEGNIIDIWNQTTSAFQAQDLTVQNVDLAAGTVTFDNVVPALGAGETAILTIADALDAAGNYIGIQGLASCINTTTLFGVDPANFPKWKSFNADPIAAGGSFTEPKLEAVIDSLRIQGRGAIPDVVLTSYTNIRQYKEEIRSNQRRQNDTIETKSGRRHLAFDYEGKMIAIIGDRYVKPGVTYGWVSGDLVKYEARPLDWHAPNGDVLLQVPRTTMTEGILYELCELAPRLRNSSFFSTNWSTV